MDAVHAYPNFKLSDLGIALSTVMKDVLYHQVIPIEMYCFFVSNVLMDNFFTQSRLGNLQSP
jgi:hypothetical protein